MTRRLSNLRRLYDPFVDLFILEETSFGFACGSDPYSGQLSCSHEAGVRVAMVSIPEPFPNFFCIITEAVSSQLYGCCSIRYEHDVPVFRIRPEEIQYLRSDGLNIVCDSLSWSRVRVRICV